MRKFLLFIFAVTGLPIMAQSTFKVDNLTYQVVGNGTVRIVDADSKATGDLVIPAQVTNEGTTYNVTSIGEEAFKWSSFTSVTFPSTMDSVYKSAFSSAEVANLKLNDGLKYIGSYVFSGCPLGALDVPSSVEVIDDHAFFGSSWKTILPTLTLHDGLKYIGASAFYGTSMAEVDIPATVDSIGSTAFLQCKKLTTVRLHDGLKKLGDGVFNKCSLLSTITLPSTLESVGIELFMNDKALTAINIPAGLKEIGESMIAGTSVATITLDPANPYFVESGGVIYTKDYVLLKLAPIKGLTSYTVSNKTLGIDGGAFMGSDIESITVPDGLVAINDYAFCQSKLSSINFPSTLVFMGEQPLASTQLTDVTLPENVPFINDGELAGCTKLKKLTIPSSVREVYAHALFNCTDLDSVIAQGSVPPTIMDYYDEYDHPTYNVPSTTPMLVPKGSIEAYRKAGWDVLKLVESTVDPLKVVSTTPADSSLVNGYQNMSFDVVFDQNITLVNANPKVYIRKGYNYSAATVEPSGEKWHATVSGTKLSVWGVDEDNFTDAFRVDDNAEYYITIPAGTVKAAKGSVNEQVSIFVYGKSALAGIEGVSAGSSVNTKVVNRYNVAGQSVPSASRGIQIVKFSDGSVRKILIK